MKTFPLIQVDAFTSQPFRGNPAAICLLDAPADAAWMQAVAQEMNLSETAYISPRNDGFDLRWFTPTTEVDLCGHATLAAAHVLWETGRVAPNTPCRFHTRSGLLSTEQRDGWIRMEFPLETHRPMTLEPDVAEALRAPPVNAVLSERLDIALIEVESEQIVRALKPDFAQLRTFSRHGFIVTSRGNGEFDFVSRFFAPGFGIDEDPVTGAAHCVLAGYWKERLGKSTFTAYQASARGGIVKVEAAAPTCYLSGQAVTVLRGELVAG